MKQLGGSTPGWLAIQVNQLYNFRGTLFCPGHRCFAPWDRGGHVCFGAAQRRRGGNFGGIKHHTPADESRAQTKQPTMRRICRAEATRATLKVATRRFPSSTTPESTGKAGFPHDLEKGALQRRATHISKRRRKALDGELAKANSSDFHAKIVD